MVERFIELEGPCNFRGLGNIPTKEGKKIKPGLIYRSDELSSLTPADWEKIKELNIKLICDLRRPDEYELYPTVIPAELSDKIRVVRWDFDAQWIEAMKGMTENIRNALAPLKTMDDEQLNQWIQLQYVKYHHGFYMCSKHIKHLILELVKEESSPVIIHCSAGKDRTGFAVVSILELLGVERSLILDEYTLTATAYEAKFPPMSHLMPLLKQNGLDDLPDHVIRKMTIAYRGALEKAIETIENENGSLLEYIKKDMEVNDDMIQDLRRIFLE